MKILLTLLCLVISMPAFAANTSYYLDATNGSDSNDGQSHAQAWQTINKANTYPSWASGDNLYFLCGETWNDALNVDWSGTVGDNVVIGAYYMDGSETIGVNEDGKPIIDGNGTEPGSINLGLIDLGANRTYVTIQDLQIQESDGNAIRTGGGCEYITIQRCVCHETYRDNILLYQTDNSMVQYCDLSEGAGNRVVSPDFWPCGGVNTGSGVGNTIQYCYIHEHYGEGVTLGEDCITQYNLVVDTMSQALNIDGDDGGIIRYNLVVGTDDNEWVNSRQQNLHAGLRVAVETGRWHGVADAEVYGNIVIGCNIGILFLPLHETYSMDGVDVYNNTFLDNRTNVQFTNPNDMASDIVLRNNIFYNPNGYQRTAQSGTYTESIIDADYNLWYPDQPSVTVWQGPNDVEELDPGFGISNWFDLADHYSFDLWDILPSAYAKDAGVDLGATYDDIISVDGTTLFQTSDPDPNTGTVIAVNLVDQDTYTPWDMGAIIDVTPPAISGAGPSGSLTCTTDPRNVTESWTTDEVCNCRIDTTDQDYDLMPSGSVDNTDSTSHSDVTSRACDVTYTMYARCEDPSGNETAASTIISYIVGEGDPPGDPNESNNCSGTGGNGSTN